MNIPESQVDDAIKSLGKITFSTYEFIIALKKLYPSTWDAVIEKYGSGGHGSGNIYSANSCAATALKKATKNGLLIQEDERIRTPKEWEWGNQWITLWSIVKNNSNFINDAILEYKNSEEFAKRVDDARKLSDEKLLDLLKKTDTNSLPEREIRSISVHKRNPLVVAFALQKAKGVCGCCKQKGFMLPNEDIYLEVHHVKPLAEGGKDEFWNAAAVCANCHREMHYGENKIELIENLYKNVTHLKKNQ